MTAQQSKLQGRRRTDTGLIRGRRFGVESRQIALNKECHNLAYVFLKKSPDEKATGDKSEEYRSLQTQEFDEIQLWFTDEG